MDRSSSEVYSDEEVQAFTQCHLQDLLQGTQVVRVGSFSPRPTGESSAEVEESAEVAFVYDLKGFARCRQSLKLYCNKTYSRHGCLLGLGLHNAGNLVIWRGGFVDIVGSW